MKTKKLFTSGTLAAAVLALACSAPRTQGATIITNTFDFTFATGGATSPFNSTWIYWYNVNPGYTNILVDPTTDSSNPAVGASTSGSGSLKVISPLTGYTQDVFFGTFASNINNAYDFSVEANTAFYTNVSFDILVAPGTPLSGSGNYGAIAVGFITSSYGQDWITGGTVTIPSSASTSWYHVVVPIIQSQDFGDVPGIALDINSYSGYPLFTITNWIDNISINASTNPPQPPGTNATAYIGIDAGSNRIPISPMIYGVAFATSAQLEDLNCTMNRSGGNAETSYNWEINAHNHASDWYFESLADSPATPGASADSVVADSKAAGAQALITIPMIGWAPILGPNRGNLASYSIAKYGPQTGNDSSWMPDAGNGISTSNGISWEDRITWNDPNDANTPVDTNFQIGYVRHLITNWGVSTNGGVGYYIMDNEHTLWSSTHMDVHPVGPTMQEILGKIEAYASMVKSVDPHALVLGPEEWGWSGYFYSGYDQQWAGSNNDYTVANYPDRKTNGGWDYMPWLLHQLYQYQTNTGQRLLDYFTLHCYPQEGNVGTSDTDTATELLRNASTRQFWDPTYTDPSWIGSIIMLIPRMSNWVATYYPGTKIGITEYNWGAEDSMNGGTAQADILGIFGREGLDLATRWGVPDPAGEAYLAMKIYRNYDGNKSTFGDTSVLATGPDPDDVSVFGAERSKDGALTIMVVNKYLTGNTPLVINLTNYTGSGSAQVWQLNSSDVIAQLSNLPYSAGMLQTTVPSPSVTLLVIQPSPTLSMLAAPHLSGTNFQFCVKGEIGGTFVLQSSTNLSTWVPVGTYTFGTPQYQFLLPASGGQKFYRAVSTAL
jgi:hypothetical protein